MPTKINYQDPHAPVHNISLMTESLWELAQACLWTYPRFSRKKKDIILNAIKTELSLYRVPYEGYVSIAMDLFEQRRRYIIYDENIVADPAAWFRHHHHFPDDLPVKVESPKTRLYKKYALAKLPLAVLSFNNNPTKREFNTWVQLLFKRRGNHETFIFITVLALKQFEKE